MKVEKELKVEDRHRQGLEIQPIKVLKSMGWSEQYYHTDQETKTIYVYNLDNFMKRLGIEMKPMAESIKWKGWTWKRGGKDKD